ncbi:winged helix-turn-helix domain-containing protein [Thauera sp. SDU_THAU2]|uniref:winged helix-turn-helix domain-containing protein n=1 Tax=Thauera sp. SDU_THAU2 TaxID=3136633 RepID=UPI00311D4E6D
MKSICADLVMQRLNPDSGVALNRQLYECLRQAILEGTLPSSTALPASRDLAREAGMSRNTVTHAYEQLRAEGYVHARVGSGTFVAETTPDSLLNANATAVSPALSDAPARLSRQAQALLASASAGAVQWGRSCPVCRM